MAKKKKSSPLLIGAVIIIGAIALIPKEVWGLLLLIVGAVFIVWLAKKMLKGKSSVGPSAPSKNVQAASSRASHPPPLPAQLRQPAPKRASCPPPLPAQPRQPATQRAEESFANFVVDITPEVGEYRVPPPPSSSEGLRWIPAGEKISLIGFGIPGGLFYVGNGHRDRYGQIEPSLINPQLRVTQSPVDWSLRLTDYWPSYSSISADARRAYLQWLADGRRAPEANIGYVFLFFYGLERRVLVDLGLDSKDSGEVTVIQAEIRRLLKIYGGNGSFRGYATSFLAFIDAGDYGNVPLMPDPPKILEQGYELPLSLKLGLGQYAATQKPVPASWAMAWALNDPNIHRRTPVSRCETEFKTLFSRKYAEAYGDGLVLRLNKTKLQVSYHPASSVLAGRVGARNIGNLPDVTAVKGPIQKLQTLVDACTESLDAFSRFIGRNPDKAQALEGLLQLPVELWPAAVRAELDDIKSRVGDGMLVMAFGELSGRLKSAGPLSRDKVLGLARALEALHIGIEPDVLNGSRAPKAEDKIALFTITAEDVVGRTGHAYQAAAVTLDLACMAAHADGEVSAPELMSLTKQINAWTHLSDTQRKRLKAHLRLGIDQPATLASLKKKFEPLAEDARHAICRLLAHLTQADGVVSPAEVKFLERTYKAMALDAKLVYSDLHTSAQTSGIAMPSADITTKAPIVAATATGDVPFALDPARIAQLEKETAEVSELLARVFVDEDAHEPIPVAETEVEVSEESAQSSGILGLDSDHSAFVRLLITRSSWLRSELADAASDMELMLDGALEHINETALDALEAPLTEGDDPIEINKEVLEALHV